MTTEHEHLLRLVSQISSKHEATRRDPSHTFDVFSILRDATDEVGLHSRFLSELLKPDGLHQQREAFLRAFLGCIEIDTSSFSLERVTVSREKDHIDILITNGMGQAIIIENKIFARDQDRQIERYYEQMRKKGFKVVSILYLTLDGRSPLHESIGTCPPHIVRECSYEFEIAKWLEACIQITALIPVLRETLVQYRTLIRVLTGQVIEEEYIMELKKLLLQDHNLQLAVDIQQAIGETEKELQLQFWTTLEQQLRGLDYKILDNNKFTADKISRAYGSRRTAWGKEGYGLEIDIPDLHATFYIQLRYKLYMLFKRPDQQSEVETLTSIVSRMNVGFKFDANPQCVAWKEPQNNFVFGNHDDKSVIALADINERTRLIRELGDEVDGIIKDARKIAQRT